MSVIKSALRDPAGRREQNKIQTRAAIAEAAYSLFALNGYDNVTVAQVADRAGVSRRTFFNYFASLDDALQHYICDLLDIAISVLDELPDEYTLVDATELAIKNLADRAVLAPLAELYAQSHRSPSLQVNAHASWAIATESLSEKIAARLPEADPFALTVFSFTVIGAAKAAFTSWVPTLTDTIEEQDIQRLYSMLTSAMELVKNGFPSLAIITNPKGA